MRLLQWPFLRKMPGNTVADWRSLAPPACCQSLPKHHVVWNCLGVVVAGFRNMAWVRIAGGMLFSVIALAVDRFVTIGRRTAQFCFGLLMRCLFLGSPLRPPRLLTRQLCGSGCVCRPEFSIIRLKNNSIYLKPGESFVYIGGRVSISWLQQIA